MLLSLGRYRLVMAFEVGAEPQAERGRVQRQASCTWSAQRGEGNGGVSRRHSQRRAQFLVMRRHGLGTLVAERRANCGRRGTAAQQEASEAERVCVCVAKTKSKWGEEDCQK